jgi:hypothetical protein
METYKTSIFQPWIPKKGFFSIMRVLKQTAHHGDGEKALRKNRLKSIGCESKGIEWSLQIAEYRFFFMRQDLIIPGP